MHVSLPDPVYEDLLLAQARQGDQAAIMDIYKIYFSPIYRFIRLRVDDSSLAEDLTSDVFVKLVDALRGRSAPQHSLRGWLFRVARHEMHRQLGRKQQPLLLELDDWLAASDEDMEIQFVRRLDAERAKTALRMLAPDQLEVLLLRFGQGLNLQETAEAMSKNIGAIKALQFRAVNTLRQIMGEMRAESYE